jgi:hypothetical protein
MTKKIPFTEASLARAIKGVERAGLFVVGVKPDGTLIVSNRPNDTALLVPAPLQNDPDSKWEDKRAYEHDSSPAPKRRFGERLSTVAARSDEMAAPSRAHDRPRRRREGGWGFFATVDDPKIIESYRAAGSVVYEDGELEELIRKCRLGKREAAALGGFFRARFEPADVKGAGPQITRRLITRGYIEVAESHGKDRKHRITPAGEAEWLRLAKNDDQADQP